MNRLLVLLLVVIALPYSSAFSIQLRQMISSAIDIAKGVMKDITSFLPKPRRLFESAKQVLIGYPFEFVSAAINAICSSAVASKTLVPQILPKMTKMQFQLRTCCTTLSFPIRHAERMWSSPEFNASKKVVILATGWTTTVNDTNTISAFAEAYNCRGDSNFLAIDAANFVDTLYSWAALNTDEIGRLIAIGLTKLTKVVPVENIHLIGHSLGAHVVGAAARYFNETTNKSIPRITGLDPAKPCFNEGHKLSGLMRGDADFIDIIHTNPGVLGKRDPMGDADFYPNGLHPLQPGCFLVTCSHARAWEYFVESVYPGNENNFPAIRCSSMSRLRENKCVIKPYPMGYAAPNNLKGNYFLETNSKSPYGKNSSSQNNNPFKICCLCEEKSSMLKL